MNKHILLILLLILLGQAGIAQPRVIKSPKVEAATQPNVIIDRISLSDTATVLDFTVSSTPGQWIIFAKKNYLINSEGGNKIYCKYAIGYNGQLGDKWYMPESGKVHFSLVYPPIDKKLSKIDFIEGDNIDGAFKIDPIPRLAIVKIKKNVAVNDDDIIGIKPSLLLLNANAYLKKLQEHNCEKSALIAGYPGKS